MVFFSSQNKIALNLFLLLLPLHRKLDLKKTQIHCSDFESFLIQIFFLIALILHLDIYGRAALNVELV